MAHMILENDNMFSVGEAPWHKLGVVLDAPPTIEEAIEAAKLNWEVGTKPLFTAEGTAAPALATFRKDTSEILGVVGPSYKVLQNKEAFNFFNPFLQSKEATLETAGSLNNNRRVWVLAKINRPDMVIVPKADDRVSKYVMLSNSHDGTLAVRVGFTNVRVVCNNTLSAAINDNASKLIRIRHSGDITGSLDKIHEIMNLADSQFEATAEQYRALAAKQVSKEDLDKYIKLVFATKKQMELMAGGEEVSAGDRVKEKIIQLFEGGRGNDLPGVKGTMWGLYNATNEYLQYFRGENEATRLDSIWFGQAATLNKKAFEVALTMAA